MNAKILWLVATAVAAGAAYGAPPEKPVEASERVDSKIVDAHTALGFGLSQEFVIESGGKRNVVISPASVSFALSMTYNGASGSTKDAMAKTLGYSGMSLDQVNAGNKVLVANLQQPGEGIEISVANSLWARKDVGFKPDFLQRSKDFYQAKVTTLDFGSQGAADTINGWVKEQTRGKIDKIITQINAGAILYLVNAVYFKGLWSAPFEEKLTKDGTFTLDDGADKTVPMMHRTGHYEYLQGDNFQVIGLPYGKGRLSMYVVLPAKDTGLMSLCMGLTSESCEQWLKLVRGHSVEVELTLPKFKLEYEVTANKALSALGMGVAFDPDKADFHAMCRIPPTPNVYIGEVLHKTFIEVNEKGTEAAAATSVGMVATAAPMPAQIAKMVVDHPFLFAIRDNMTGETLFMGLVVDPR